MWRQFTGERRVLGDLVERWNGSDLPESCGQRALDLADVAGPIAGRPPALAPPPPHRFARITRATRSRISGGNTARISESPVWCRRTPGMDLTFAKRRGRSL